MDDDSLLTGRLGGARPVTAAVVTAAALVIPQRRVIELEATAVSTARNGLHSCQQLGRNARDARAVVERRRVVDVDSGLISHGSANAPCSRRRIIVSESMVVGSHTSRRVDALAARRVVDLTAGATAVASAPKTSFTSSDRGNYYSPYNFGVLDVWVSAGGSSSTRDKARAAAVLLFDSVSPFVPQPTSGAQLPHFLLELAKLGKAACDRMRTTFLRYIRFLRQEFPESQPLVPLPATVDLVVRFLNYVAARRVIEIRAAGNGKLDKGTTGKQIKGNLARVGVVFGSILPATIFGSSAVKSASRGMSLPVPPQEYNMSVALALHLETYALGEYFDRVLPGVDRPVGWSPIATSRARDVLVCTYMSMRGASLGRLRVDSFVAATEAGDAYGRKAYFTCSSIDKAPSQAAMISKWHVMLGVGLLRGGIELWLPDWFHAHRGREFRMLDLAPPKASIWSASGFAEAPVADLNRAVTAALRQFAASEPFNQHAIFSKQLGLSMRSARHFLTSLTTALGEADQEPAYSLGYWTPSSSSRGSSRVSLPFRYAGSELRRLVSCQTRLRVFYRMQNVIGDPASWRNRIPLQSKLPPSFAFLVASPIPIEVSDSSATDSVGEIVAELDSGIAVVVDGTVESAAAPPRADGNPRASPLNEAASPRADGNPRASPLNIKVVAAGVDACQDTPPSRSTRSKCSESQAPSSGRSPLSAESAPMAKRRRA